MDRKFFALFCQYTVSFANPIRLCNACGVKYRVQLKRSNKKPRTDGAPSGRRGAAAAQDSEDDHTPDSEDVPPEPSAAAAAPSSSSRANAPSAAEAEIVGRVAKLVSDLDELRETTRQIDASKSNMTYENKRKKN